MFTVVAGTLQAPFILLQNMSQNLPYRLLSLLLLKGNSTCSVSIFDAVESPIPAQNRNCRMRLDV